MNADPQPWLGLKSTQGAENLTSVRILGSFVDANPNYLAESGSDLKQSE